MTMALAMGGAAMTMGRGIGVETASGSVGGRVTGGGVTHGGACRIGALGERGCWQRDARAHNSGNQCEFGLVDHGLSPEFATNKNATVRTSAHSMTSSARASSAAGISMPDDFDLVAALAQNRDGLRADQAGPPMTTIFIVYKLSFSADVECEDA